MNKNFYFLSLISLVFLCCLATVLDTGNEQKRQDYISQIEAIDIELRELRAKRPEAGDAIIDGKIRTRLQERSIIANNLENLPK